MNSTERQRGAYTPAPPEGFVSPVTWGVEATVRERFGAAGMPSEHVTCERSTYVFRHNGLPTELLDSFRHYYGPTMNAFAAAESNWRTGELQGELTELFAAQNQGGPTETVIPATFLKVTVRKP